MKDISRGLILPAPIDESGILYLAPPRTHTLNSIKSLVEGIEDATHNEPVAGLLAISLSRDLLQQLTELLPTALSQSELQGTRSLVIKSGESIELADLAAMQSLATLIAQIRGRWLRDLLRDGRLTSHFQPIVDARAGSSIFAYECLVRGVDLEGILISPDRMYQAAREADLLFALDQSARLTAIRQSAEFGLDAAGIPIFVNFDPSSIYDPPNCFLSTIVAVSRTVFDPGRIVFEIVDSERFEDIEHIKRIVGYYRDAGFLVAIDDVGAGNRPLNLIAELKPDFIKLSMRLIRGVDRSSHHAEIVRGLIEFARRLGVQTVAAGIETEEEWAWLRDEGVDYVQGYLFAKPAHSPSHVRDQSDRWTQSLPQDSRPVLETGPVSRQATVNASILRSAVGDS